MKNMPEGPETTKEQWRRENTENWEQTKTLKYLIRVKKWQITIKLAHNLSSVYLLELSKQSTRPRETFPRESWNPQLQFSMLLGAFWPVLECDPSFFLLTRGNPEGQ
jgi:hypothetical protein